MLLSMTVGWRFSCNVVRRFPWREAGSPACREAIGNA